MVDGKELTSVSQLSNDSVVTVVSEAKKEVIRVKVIKKKYQHEKGNVPESELPIHINLEVSPEILLTDLKDKVKANLHPKYKNQVELKGSNFAILQDDSLSLIENGIYDNCTILSS